VKICSTKDSILTSYKPSEKYLENVYDYGRQMFETVCSTFNLGTDIDGWIGILDI
jgi:hypothetical protein